MREAFVNQIIHADYLPDAGTLKVIKRSNEFEFTNPGILKLPVEDIYRGGNSKSRNPRMQTMLRMVGFGDNAGSGFPAILATWKNAGWIEPVLEEDTGLNQVTLTLKMISKSQEVQGNSNPESIETAEKLTDKTVGLEVNLSDRHKQILSLMDTNVEYSAEEIAEFIGLKGSRTRQLLKELADKGKICFTAATKNRKYKKI
nr:ATP-binding protein [uncultured Blautia sp.]